MQQSFQILDILSVISIIIVATLWLLRVFLKMRKNKCATICNGCSGTSCNLKTFKKTTNLAVNNLMNPTKKVIIIHSK